MIRYPYKLIAVLGLACFASAAVAEEDAVGCKDHPLFNRMPGYHINSCEALDFDSAKFLHGPQDAAKSEVVEGAITRLSYRQNEGAKKASPLQITRNYQNAVKAAGGEVMLETSNYGPSAFFPRDEHIQGHHPTSLRLKKSGKEIWAAVVSDDGIYYTLLVAERQGMEQAIAANDLLASLSKVGFVAIYLNFDTGKATLQPDAAAQLDQMAQLLKRNAALKVEVGGHTDNVGDAAANQKLSEARAQTVMQELVKRGIAAARLTAKGYGASLGIADNRLEDGRARNRRVELVKK